MFTAAQLKGKIKYFAKQKNLDARILLRIYMMERFLERITNSNYVDKIVIKGGVLITSMIGISLRSTMDIDTSIQEFKLSKRNVQAMIQEIINIDISDGVIFQIREFSEIMDNMEYPGLRVSIDAIIDEMKVPFKVDLSTGDAITPSAIEYKYRLMFEDRTILLKSYNIETILAEKLQTILSRGILNTRMRDFYDIHVLMSIYKDDIDKDILKKSFFRTCSNRKTFYVMESGNLIIDKIVREKYLKNLWVLYQKKYEYAQSIDYETVMYSILVLFKIVEL